MKNLKLLRKEKKLTLEELSKIIGISNQMLSNYELGKVNPPLELIIKLSNYFNCSIDYLLGHQTQGILHLDNLTQYQRKLVELIQKLSNDQALIAIGYFSEMLNLPYSEVKPVNKPF